MTVPSLEKTRFDRLVQLALDRFDRNLYQVEARVIEHSVRSADFEPLDDSVRKPAIRPEFLRWLATDSEATALIDPKGIRVLSATIPGRLDLHACLISHPLKFLECSFEEDICLATANLPAFYFMGGELAKGIVADGVTVRGPLFVKNVKSSGAIRLVGATVDGNLDCSGTILDVTDASLILDGARFRCSVFLHAGFKSTGEIRMLNAQIGGDLGFDGAQLTGMGNALSLDKVVIEGGMSLSDGFQSSGSIRLLGCQISGDLNCTGALITAEGIALNLATANIQGHLYLCSDLRRSPPRHFRSSGQVCLHSARIGNSVDCTGAVFTRAVTSILLEEANVGGSVYISDGFESFGRVEFHGAKLHRDLVCEGATLLALYCAKMELSGELIWTSIKNPKQTSLWLNGATIRNIRDDRESWPGPGGLHLDGLTYQDLTLQDARTPINRERNELGRKQKVNVLDRISWLNLQTVGEIIEPQPWMQLANLLKGRGELEDSKRVIFEMRRHQAGSSWLPFRWWKAHLEMEPFKILISILILATLGSFVFWYAGIKGAMAPTSKEAYSAWSKGEPYNVAYPRFNPIIYSLENGLPLVKLGQDEKWAPDPSRQTTSWIESFAFLSCFRWFLILSGWVQATVLASAIGSRFKT
jgi:hypothetical protein